MPKSIKISTGNCCDYHYHTSSHYLFLSDPLLNVTAFEGNFEITFSLNMHFISYEVSGTAVAIALIC
jgi:hypothetical protein